MTFKNRFKFWGAQAASLQVSAACRDRELASNRIACAKMLPAGLPATTGWQLVLPRPRCSARRELSSPCRPCFAQRGPKVTIDMLMGNYHIAVVGATGAAGTELLRVLERRNFPVASLRAIGSARSAGKSVPFRGESVPVEKLDDRCFDKIDIAFFSAGGDVSRNYVPIACQSDAIAIDKSSAFRMEPHVPLVIPEINADDVRRHRGIIANPNCTTTVMLMALYPLHRIFHVRRVFAASYQAVSGSGTRGVEELTRQTRDAVRGPKSAYEPGSTNPATVPNADSVYPHPIAFNLLPHIDSFLESGYTKEEAK